MKLKLLAALVLVPFVLCAEEEKDDLRFFKQKMEKAYRTRISHLEAAILKERLDFYYAQFLDKVTDQLKDGQDAQKELENFIDQGFIECLRARGVVEQEYLKIRESECLVLASLAYRLNLMKQGDIQKVEGWNTEKEIAAHVKWLSDKKEKI